MHYALIFGVWVGNELLIFECSTYIPWPTLSVQVTMECTYYRGRRYGVKLRDYPQVSLTPLFLVVILDPEKSSTHFF